MAEVSGIDESYVSFASTGGEESGFQSEASTVTGPDASQDEDPYSDGVVPLICCCILILFVLMIILLILISNLHVTEYEDPEKTVSVSYSNMFHGPPGAGQNASDSDEQATAGSGQNSTRPGPHPGSGQHKGGHDKHGGGHNKHGGDHIPGGKSVPGGRPIPGRRPTPKRTPPKPPSGSRPRHVPRTPSRTPSPTPRPTPKRMPPKPPSGSRPKRAHHTPRRTPRATPRSRPKRTPLTPRRPRPVPRRPRRRPSWTPRRTPKRTPAAPPSGSRHRPVPRTPRITPRPTPRSRPKRTPVTPRRPRPVPRTPPRRPSWTPRRTPKRTQATPPSGSRHRPVPRTPPRRPSWTPRRTPKRTPATPPSGSRHRPVPRTPPRRPSWTPRRTPKRTPATPPSGSRHRPVPRTPPRRPSWTHRPTPKRTPATPPSGSRHRPVPRTPPRRPSWTPRSRPKRTPPTPPRPRPVPRTPPRTPRWTPHPTPKRTRPTPPRPRPVPRRPPRTPRPTPRPTPKRTPRAPPSTRRLPVPVPRTPRRTPRSTPRPTPKRTPATPPSVSTPRPVPRTPPTTPSTIPPPSYENRAFTLICVFEYLPYVLPRNTPQCTDYVYIRFFVYSQRANQEPLVFEKKKRYDGTVKLYYDDTREVWRKLGSYRILDNNVRNSKRNFRHSRWFLGMWGATFSRLMSGLWNEDIFRAALRNTLRGNFSDKLKITDINGFAIINTILADTRPLGRAKSFGEAFRSVNNPILEPGWAYIHTVAIWPGGEALVPESMVANILRDADVVGISTSNSTDESNIILSRGSGNTVPYMAASPPNPIMPPGPGTRGMLDILRDFPHWKQVLKRQKLCFSVTTSINYAHNSVDNIDFVYPIRLRDDVQRYRRLRFTTKNRKHRYPVEDMGGTTYHYDDTTHTHFWRLVRSGKLLTFFAYDTGKTLSYKVTEMLKVYGNDKCVVFDDLGEDAMAANFTARGRTVHFGKFEMLSAVHSVMRKKYGVPFPG
ncbi:uncharacterized protein [Dermacentor albipictus]|uniref:uncharacterized protein isoform X12 n=1 Tax=Dermacentor albipictus TaxID=60249 RepID=UPI0031FDDF17